MKIIIILLCIVLIISVGVCSGREVIIYVKSTSNYLDEMSEAQKLTYVIGLYEGIALVFEEEWFFTLTCQMNISQIKKIYEKYLENHPEKLHLAPCWLFRESLKDAYEKLYIQENK